MQSTTARPPLIAHVIFRLGTGGLENGLVNLINNLPKEKYRHAIICMTDYTHFRDRIHRDDVDIYCLNKKEGKDLLVYYRLWKLLSKLKPDVIHTRNLSALEAQLPAYLAGIKRRIHGEHGRDVEDLDGTNFKHTQLRRFFRLFVHRYVPMSRDLETWLIRQIKVAPKKVTQIYNGVDMAKFAPTQNKPSSLLPANFQENDLIIIGTVGRQAPVKDPVTLLQAFILWAKAKPKLAEKTRLVMVGNGSLHQLLQQQAQESGLAHLIWLAGDRSDVAQLMQAFDIFVLPSISEGISNTILEAMASGLPVIATRVGGNPELVVDQQSGFLVDRQNPQALADAINHYVEHPGTIRQHGEFGRQVCEQRFSLQRMLSDYMSVYDQVLNNHG
jgi:sugar transferase (PEP-CTERM/EpsH1 system associated)